MDPIKTTGTLDGISPLKDGGMSWRFHTQEVPPAAKAQAMEYYQQFGQILFAPEGRELTESDLDVYSKHMPEGKTPSQRLRGVIYKLWEQAGPVGDFEIYYKQKMEGIIERLKERL